MCDSVTDPRRVPQRKSRPAIMSMPGGSDGITEIKSMRPDTSPFSAEK